MLHVQERLEVHSGASKAVLEAVRACSKGIAVWLRDWTNAGSARQSNEQPVNSKAAAQ